MAEQRHPVQVEAIDWPALFPWLRIFSSFRIAIHAPKMLLSLALVIVLFLFGQGLDLIFGDQVLPGEVDAYKRLEVGDYQRWRNTRAQDLNRELRRALVGMPAPDLTGVDEGSYAQRVDAALDAVDEYYLERPEQRSSWVETRRRVRAVQPRGVFESALDFKLSAFERMVRAATSFQFGIDDLLAGQPYNPNTVMGALRDLVVVLPGWLYRSHCGFLVAWIIGAMILWALVGGTICRMAALHACRGEANGINAAFAFARNKFWWFLLAPIIPLLFVLLIALVMALGGMLFNLPVTDVFASLGFFLWLIAGFIATLTLIGLAGGVNLLYPAIAVEGAEAFDALSRAYHYVFFRPWRLVFYYLVALVYGAITYLLVGLVVFLALWVTQRFTGAWVFTEAGAADVNRFDAIMPAPQIGTLVYETDWAVLGPSGKVAAVIVKVWVMLLVGVLPAFAISYYFVSNTWAYLLLRRAADGAAFDDVYVEDGVAREAPAAAPDRVEPDQPADIPPPPPSSP